MASHTSRVADNIDVASRGVLFEGANLTQLCQLFKMDFRTVTAKMHGVPPDGVRGRSSVWRIDTAAPHLVKPIYDIETYMRNMAHTDLPKMLTKEYWAGQRSRQEYELKAGDSWPTSKIVEHVGELMKIFKMSSRLFVDAVDRHSQLTPKQRDIIKSLVDGMLNECNHHVVKKFSYTPSNSTTIYNETVVPEVDDDDEL